MVILIKKLLTFILLFFTFNLLHIDSNSDKRLIYDTNDLYDYSYHNIYFINTNTNELKDILNNLDINVLSYTINDKKYYFRNVDKLEEYLLKDLNINDKTNYYYNGIKVDSISVLCNTNELIKLNNSVKIY